MDVVVAHGILLSALGPHFGLGLRLGPGLDNYMELVSIGLVHVGSPLRKFSDLDPHDL